MYASTNPGSSHGDFQDRNGVNYVTSSESFGHCSQLFWKKDPNDSGPSSTINWCDQLPSSTAALSSSSLSPPSLSSSSLSLESPAPPQAPAPPAPPTPGADVTPASDDMESDERPYVCDLCNCAYKHASSLLNHKLTHRIGDFKCDFCSKPYTNYMSLRNHMRIHGQKRYMCDLCGKAFRLARYLRNHQRIHDDGPNRFDCPSCCKSYRTMLELAQHRCSAAANNQNKFNCPSCFKSYRTMLDLAQHRCSAAAKNQTSSRRSNFSAPRRHQPQQQQQSNASSMMAPQHGGHGPQEPLPSHCVSPMPQGAPGTGVPNQTVPDHQDIAMIMTSTRETQRPTLPHKFPSKNPDPSLCSRPFFRAGGRNFRDSEVCPSVVSSQSAPQSMRSSSKLVSSPSPAPSSSYSLLQPLVPEVKEMGSGYTRLSVNPMTKHQDTFSLAPQRPLTAINPLGHSLHPNGAASLKPSPVPRSIQPMPWEQRSLYNQ